MLEVPFFDREAELARLLLALEQRRDWSLVLGPRKSGKTRLLHELQARLPDRVLSVYLDLWERVYDAPRLLRDLILALLDAAGAHVEAFARRGPLPSMLAASEGDGAIVAWLRGFPPGTKESELADSIAGLLTALSDPRRVDTAIGAVIDLPERFARVTGAPVWMIWDEFQELGNVRFGARTEPFALLRSRWQTHKHVHYVVAGSRRTALERIALDAQAPFFQHFDLLVVDQFPPPLAAEFLQAAGKAFGRTISRALAEEAVQLVGGLPFHLAVLAQELASRPGRASKRDLIECLDQQLHQPSGRLYLSFAKLYGETVRSASGLARVLDVLEEPKSISELARASGLPPTSVNAYVTRLLEEGVVSRERGKVSVVDRAFALWLAGRRGSPRGVPTVHLGSEFERRVAELLAELGFTDIFLARASRGAFDLVASYGATLVGFQVKRSKLPLRLSAASVERMRRRAEELGWRPRVAVDVDGQVRFYDVNALRGTVIDDRAQPLVTVRDILQGQARGRRRAKN